MRIVWESVFMFRREIVKEDMRCADELKVNEQLDHLTAPALVRAYAVKRNQTNQTSQIDKRDQT